MAKAKAPAAARSEGARKGLRRTIGSPDASVLARYSPSDLANAHPDWVKNRFPAYIASHAGHDSTAVREFSHAGHVVKIITTYRVEVDGRPVQAHLSVDEDGRVYTHATPFVTYSSAVDLMKSVVDAYPTAFADAGGHGGHPDDGHDDGHRGARR